MFRLETFKLPTRILMLITLVLGLTACGNGGGAPATTPTTEAVWDQSNWDEKNWQ